MDTKFHLTLYSTLGCHLCELAENLVYQSSHVNLFILSTIDISEDEALLNEYGVRIPVVKNETTGKEISWPFDLHEFEAWLSKS